LSTIRLLSLDPGDKSIIAVPVTSSAVKRFFEKIATSNLKTGGKMT
jgi:hypothetical protein